MESTTPSTSATHQSSSGQATASGPEDRTRHKAAQHAQEARHAASQAEDAAAEAREQGRQLAEDAKQAADEAVQQAKQTAVEAVDRAKRETAGAIAGEKDRLAEKVTDVEAAVRRAAEKLYDEEDDSLARFADGAAEQIGAAARYLRGSDLRGLVSDAEQLARRRPEVFLGGLFIAGLGAGRFLKASGNASSRHQSTGPGNSTEHHQPDAQSASGVGSTPQSGAAPFPPR